MPIRCYYCDGTLGTNAVLASSTTGSHVIFSTVRRRVWIACEACGRWNMPDVASADALLGECEQRYGRSPRALTIDGIGQVAIGTLRLTHVDCASPTGFLALRHSARIAGRSRRIMRWGPAIQLAALLCSSAGTVAVGGLTGSLLGGLALIGGLTVVGRLQRLRRLAITLEHERSLVLTRGEATRVAVQCDGAGWKVQVPSAAGVATLRGRDGLTVLARILPLFPRVFTTDEVTAAITLLEHAVDMDAVIVAIAEEQEQQARTKDATWNLGPGRATIWALTQVHRLVLEMIATEQHERDVLKAEVSVLQLRLQEAAEIARIIDEELTETPTRTHSDVSNPSSSASRT